MIIKRAALPVGLSAQCAAKRLGLWPNLMSALSCISQQVSHAEPADLQSHGAQPVSSAKLAYFPVPPVQGMVDLRAEQSQHADSLTWPNTARCATAMRAWGLVGG